MDFGDLLTGILVLIVGGILGGIGTYLVKPPLDAWLEKHRKAREAREAARKTEEEAAKQLQLADQYALDYRDKLVWELRNLRILDMVRPLDLERTYVRVGIREAQPTRYADAEEMATLAQGDPNLLFELSKEKLDEDKAESLLPEEALRRYRHMVVLGDPGAGKTTMLKYLCLLSAQARLGGFPDFPVFVTFNRFAKAHQDSLLDFIIDDVVERYGFQQLRPYLEQRLEDGSVLLLLDGLDEVTVGSPEEAEAVYHRTTEGINRLATRYPKCPMVVTSRRAGWKGLLAPTFIVTSVLDFSWEDIQHFINNWFGEGSDRARRLHGVLSQQARMQALAANPLLLSLIAIVFERDLELPERRAKLYERCVQVLLTEWDAHRGIKRASQFTTDRKRDLLEDIALHYHCQGLRYFPKDNLLEVIAAYLPTVNIPAEQAPLVLDEISAQHGLLKEQAADWYGFLHLTLQEYFAAVSLDKGNQLDLALAHMHNPWWEEVILLLAGMLKDATPLLEAILAERDDIFFSNLLLTGRCLVGTPRIGRVQLREQINADLKSLVESESQHWLPRTQAVKILCEADEEKGSEYLLSLLGNGEIHWRIRMAAADALGASGKGKVVPDLLAFLPDEGVDLNVREQIADALINLGNVSATPYLLDLLSNQEISSQIRGRIARNLGESGDKAVIPHLLALLPEQWPDHYIPWYCGRALRYLKFTTAPNELLAVLQDDNNNLMARWALAKAVDNLDKAAGLEIVSWLSDESIEKSVRWSFAYRLGRMGDPIRDKMEELYSNAALDLSMRASSAITLLDLGETKLVPELKRLLVNPDVNYYIRLKIAETLVLFGERDLAGQLVTLLQEKSLPSFVRLKAADLLASLSDSTVAPQLLDFLQDEDVEPRVRARAADTLSALDLNGLVANVRALVTDERVDSLVRGRAANCLTQDKNGVAWLIELLDRDDIGEDVYSALYNASRQAGVSVFRTEGGYEVLPLQPR
jgi:HEAT repeat protein